MDLRHAELGVELEEQPSIQNGQVVLVPVPQVLQVLVVDGQERVSADEARREKQLRKKCFDFSASRQHLRVGSRAALAPGGSMKRMKEPTVA